MDTATLGDPAEQATDAKGPSPASGADDRPSRRRLVGVRMEHVAAETARLYAGEWTRFAGFCAAAGERALAASPQTVADFLATLGRGRATARRALAAIDQRHRQLGLPPPGGDPCVRAALKAVCKAAPRRPRPSPPAASALHQAVLRCPGDLAGLRDRAILLLLAHNVARRAVVGLQAEHLRWHEDRVDLGHALALPRATRHDLCPARGLEAWLRASAIRYGPVFRKVTRWGTVEPAALGADAIRRILDRRLS